jgi:hypothetical protein
MGAPQANAEVSLSLPILRKGQYSGEPPVARLQFMLNFVDGIVGKQSWTALLRRWLLFSQPG